MTHQAVNSLIRRCRRPCAIPVASIWPTEAQICGPYAIISTMEKDDGAGDAGDCGSDNTAGTPHARDQSD